MLDVFIEISYEDVQMFLERIDDVFYLVLLLSEVFIDRCAKDALFHEVRRVVDEI
jgi:hypothetical protein